MRFVEELLEWTVYLAVVGAIAVSVPRNFVEFEDALPSVEVGAEEVALEVVEFTPAHHLASSIPVLAFTRIPVTASVGVPQDALERYRHRSEPFSYLTLRRLLEEVGFEGEGLRLAWAVAMRESTGNPMAHNTNAHTGDNSYGLFQINMYGNLEEYRRDKFDLPSNEVLFDPVLNAEIAFVLSKGGTDFGHWNVGPNAYNGDGSPPDVMRWLPEYPEE